MKIKELNESKLPIVRIDKSLDKYKNKVLFKEKVEKANEALINIGLPKSLPKNAKTSAQSNASPKSASKN
ncbi:MAG: hypothetical protein ABJA66_18255 [Actinomycetota bacterium]